jgi:ubiquinone/menaquinone biosynthesis C-methylase UbiE
LVNLAKGRLSVQTRYGIAGAFLLLAGCSRAPEPEPEPKVGERYVAPLFEPARAHDLLEGPERDRWQQPAGIVEALNLQPGQTVADIGAGSGYLLRRLSRAVGPKGKVYAEEIQAEYLADLRKRAKALGNVEVVLGTAEDPALPAASIDCFVMLTVYHEVRQPVEFLRGLKRFARPGATLAIIDFDARRKGDPPAPVGHEMPEQEVIDEAAAAGWDLTARHEFLSSQFFLVFH